ncbi:hypothetical protein NPIL_59921 [Nephila pilipes]|uniref:Uncharacterized protein n=1 Tax=Nephila pilipes TaxID=299642 RepID=A0A8X6N6N7_NEPPI|nr:hypothetical protein NPIL_59921 [Nephila pilipes]
MAEALRDNHCGPETSYLVCRKARSKAAEVRKSRSPPRMTSIAGPKILINLPSTQNRKLLKFGRPKHSENHDHRSPEKSYEVYRNARSKAADEVYPNLESKAAEVWKSRSPSRTTSIAGPKSFTNLPPTRNRKPPKFGRAKPSENHDNRSPEKSYEVYRNARSKAADVSDSRGPPRTTIIGAPNVLGSQPQSEIGSRRSLRWPQPSKNHDHLRPEKFYEGCLPKNPSLQRCPALLTKFCN